MMDKVKIVLQTAEHCETKGMWYVQYDLKMCYLHHDGLWRSMAVTYEGGEVFYTGWFDSREDAERLLLNNPNLPPWHPNWRAGQ